MYNVNKGKNTIEESEILEPLHKCLRELLSLDKSRASGKIEFTDHDIIAITLMYSHILGNRLIYNLKDEKVSIGLSQHLASSFGEAIQVLTKQMTAIDINVVYKDKG